MIYILSEHRTAMGEYMSVATPYFHRQILTFPANCYVPKGKSKIRVFATAAMGDASSVASWPGIAHRYAAP
jgi:hypothetical protein